MHLIYQLVNFTLLAAILWFFGRKAIAGIFKKRQGHIQDQLQAMEQGVLQAQQSQASLHSAQEVHVRKMEESRQALDAQQAKRKQDTMERLANQAAQRENAIQVSIGNARRSMIRRVKRTMLSDVARLAPSTLTIPEDYAQRSLQRIAQLIKPTNGDFVAYRNTGKLSVLLTSTRPQRQEDILALCEAVRGKFPDMVWPEGSFIENRVDAGLMGGMKLQIHDTVYDGTVLNLIDKVARHIVTTTPNPDDDAQIILSEVEKWFLTLDVDVAIYQVGYVQSVADCICLVSGLSDALYGELLRFDGGIEGMVMNLEEGNVGCVLFGPSQKVETGSQVRRTGHVIEVPVGEELLGRVVDGLGRPIDNLGDMLISETRPVEMPAPGIVERKSVGYPLYTGIKAVDALIPIGKGQRELIIGDRKTGKTAIAIDTILNQRDKDVLCIYVAIGQKETAVASITQTLKAHGAMDYTIIVCADAYHAAPMQYVAPYTGTSMGEYFMRKGRDVLIVYDDLSKHAVAYREISLLLHRPSGREAYPGDVFYLHSRLLERSARLHADAGGGSMTALPIIETQEGDISAYIPTNAISITDGQIFLESELFHQGQVPAVNIGLSVSRVGGSAQTGPMRQVASRLRMELAQYRELSTFSQFGSDLDKGTKDSLARGERMMYALRQDQYQPYQVGYQVLMLQAMTKGYGDGIPPEKIPAFEKALCEEFSIQYQPLIERLSQKEKLSEEGMDELVQALDHFKEGALQQ